MYDSTTVTTSSYLCEILYKLYRPVPNYFWIGVSAFVVVANNTSREPTKEEEETALAAGARLDTVDRIGPADVGNGMWILVVSRPGECRV